MIFPMRKADLLWREVENEVIVLDQSAGKVHQFNETAAHIWKWCDGRRSSDDMAILIAREYSVSEAEAESDVARIVDQLEALGLIELRSQAVVKP